MNKVFILDGMKPEKAIQLNGQHLMIKEWIAVFGPNEKIIILTFKKLYSNKRLPNGVSSAVKFYCEYFKEHGNVDGALKAYYGIDQLTDEDIKDI